jgi:hypothetical protein
MQICVTRVTRIVKTGYLGLAKSSKCVPCRKGQRIAIMILSGRGYSNTKGAWIPMRKEVRNKRKQSAARPSNSANRIKPGLLNLDQILIAQGILTQSSDRQAVARALGLPDRKRSADIPHPSDSK